MSAFYSVRVASKVHRCDGDSYLTPCVGITPGDLYVRAAATPNHDGHGNQGWWVLRFCVNCAHNYTGSGAALAHITEDES